MEDVPLCIVDTFARNQCIVHVWVLDSPVVLVDGSVLSGAIVLF